MLKKISLLAIIIVFVFSAFSPAVFADMLSTDDIASAVDTATSENVGDGAVQDGSNEKKMQFKPMAFVENLNIMGVGMLGIFVVIGAIIIAVFILNRITSPKQQKKDE